MVGLELELFMMMREMSVFGKEEQLNNSHFYVY